MTELAVPAKKVGSWSSKKPAPPKQNAKITPIKKAGPVAKPNPGKPASKGKAVAGTKKAVKKAYTGSFDSKFAPRQKPIKSVVTYRHIIALEFWVGLIVILTKPQKDNVQDSRQIIEAASYIAVMAILFGATTGGRNPARIAAAFGGLVLLTILLMQQSTTGRFSAITTPPKEKAKPAPPPTGGGGGGQVRAI